MATFGILGERELGRPIFEISFSNFDVLTYSVWDISDRLDKLNE